MIRKLTAVKKAVRKEHNYKSLMPIYARGAQLFPADYLTCHQEADSATKAKILAQAEKRRQRKRARNLRNAAHGSSNQTVR